MKPEITQKLYMLGTMAFVIIVVAGIVHFTSYVPKIGNSLTLEEKYDKAAEIKAKYNLEGASLKRSIVKNAELDKYKNEPKDEISVRIGNKTASGVLGALEADFEPTIEFKRWNEVSFKLIPDLSAVAPKDRTLTFDKDKIKYDTPKMSFEMYDYAEGEGGYKFVWFLNEKPASNKVSFAFESSGLDFFYQPPLTQKEIDKGAFRPENVVGSYAVYHQTKGGMNDINGKEYKAGKAFHIFRPRICDVNNNCVWGDLFIDADAGIYRITIPQSFLDTCKYPVRSE